MGSNGQTSLFFDKYFKIGYYNAQNNNVLLLEDSTYALLSYVKDSATGRQDLALFKIDKLGNLIKSKIFNYFGLGYLRPGSSFNNFISSSKTSLMAVAGTYSSTTSVVIFSKIDKQTLDTIKTVLYSDGIYDYNIGNLIRMNANKIFAIGNKTNSSTSQYWPVIFELDSNLIIKNTITCTNTNSVATYFGIYDDVNKKLVLGGSVTIGMNFYSCVSLADTLGNISSFDINNDGVGNQLAQVFYSVFDNSYVTIGCRKAGTWGSNNRYKFQVAKLNSSNLTPIWRKSYGYDNLSTILYDAKLNALDGSIVAAGMYCDSLYNSAHLNYNGALFKVNSAGDSLWIKIYDNYYVPSSGFTWEAFYGIESTPEDGYILCGNPSLMPKAEAWVVKTDSLGCELSSCMSSSGIKENFQSQSGGIYPNPANNFIYLNLPKGIANADIEIINTFGQSVAKYPGNSEKINIEKLAIGTYFIKIPTKDFVPYYMKFIKE